MSQTAQSKPAQSKPGQGGRGRGPPIYGRGPPGAAAARPKRPRREPEVEVWVPNPILGKKVDSGEITTIEEILEGFIKDIGVGPEDFIVVVNTSYAHSYRRKTLVRSQ